MSMTFVHSWPDEAPIARARQQSFIGQSLKQRFTRRQIYPPETAGLRSRELQPRHFVVLGHHTGGQRLCRGMPVCRSSLASRQQVKQVCVLHACQRFKKRSSRSHGVAASDELAAIRMFTRLAICRET